MKTAGIVLIVIAAILGVLIVIDVLLEKKKKSGAAVTLANKHPQTNKPHLEAFSAEAQPANTVPTVIESDVKPTKLQ